VLDRELHRVRAAGNHDDRKPQSFGIKRKVVTGFARHKSDEDHGIHRVATVKDGAHRRATDRSADPIAVLVEHLNNDIEHVAVVIDGRLGIYLIKSEFPGVPISHISSACVSLPLGPGGSPQLRFSMFDKGSLSF